MRTPRVLRLLCALGLIGVTSLRASDDTAAFKIDPSTTGLVIFLTQTDPLIAGHALHIAKNMRGEGRRVTVFLIGEAARFALANPAEGAAPNPVTGTSLQTLLADLLAAEATVIVTPPSLRAIGAERSAVLPGAVFSCSPEIHDHMFQPTTRVVVW